MAVVLSPDDVTRRLFGLLPSEWFPDLDEAPNLNAVLAMLGDIWSNDGGDGIQQFLQYLQDQNRVQTASDFWLDFVGQDYFGDRLLRRVSEPDDSYRKRLIDNILAPRVSRCAVTCNVQNLTGYTPRVIEFRNTGDCGAWGGLGAISGTGMAWSKSGAWGSMIHPAQYLIDVTRPLGAGIPNVNGWSMSGGGYAHMPSLNGYIGGTRPPDYGMARWSSLSDIDNNRAVTDDDIYRTVADSTAAGVIAWTSISTEIESLIQSSGILDQNMYLDMTCLASDDAPIPGAMSGQGIIWFSVSSKAAQNVLSGNVYVPLLPVGIMHNSVQANVVAALLELDFLVGIDTIPVRGAVTLPTITTTGGAVGQTNKVNATVAMSVFKATATTAGKNNLSGTATALSISTAGGQIGFVTYGGLGTLQFSATSIIVQGVPLLTQTFTLGSSQLTPPGSHLGSSMVVGSSKLGTDTGY